VRFSASASGSARLGGGKKKKKKQPSPKAKSTVGTSVSKFRMAAPSQRFVIGKPKANPCAKILSPSQLKSAQGQANMVLSSLGYEPIPKTGKYDPKTCGAFTLIAMEKRSQLPAWTSCQWFKSFCAVKSMPKKKGDLVKLPPRTKKKKAATTSFAAATKAAAQTGIKDAAAAKTVGAPVVCKSMPVGTGGPQVVALQKRLNQILDSRGYKAIPITGTLDDATCGAVVFARNTLGFSWESISKLAKRDCPGGITTKGCPKGVVPQKKEAGAAETTPAAVPDAPSDSEAAPTTVPLPDITPAYAQDEYITEAEVAGKTPVWLWGAIALGAFGVVMLATRKPAGK